MPFRTKRNRVSGLGKELEEQPETTRDLEGVQSRPVVDDGVNSPKSLVTGRERAPILMRRGAERPCADVVWSDCRASSREASWSWRPDLDGSVVEGGGGRRRVVQGAGEAGGDEPLVGLSRLHLQQSQHGRVVPEFHPPLGGQAHVLRQVVHRSCKDTKRTHVRQVVAKCRIHSHFNPLIKAEITSGRVKGKTIDGVRVKDKKPFPCPLSEVGTLLAWSMCILVKSPCCHSHGPLCVFCMPVFITLGISNFMPSTLPMADHFPAQTAALSSLLHSLPIHCAQSPS